MEPLEAMDFIEAVRKRPAMYIGSTSIRGFNHLLVRLVNDIFEATEADYFSFEIIEKLKGKIVFKNLQKDISDNAALDFWRPYENNFQGFELATLNALSKHFDFLVCGKNNNELFHQIFEKGELKQGKIKNQAYEVDRIEIIFDLDDTIFEIPEPFNPNFYLEEIRNLAYFHKGKTLEIIYSLDDKTSNSIFKFENGMKDKIEVEKRKGWRGTYFDIYAEKTFNDFTFEVAFCFRETPVDQALLISYANYIYTHENGAHVNAFLQGICQAVKQYVLDKQLDVKITSSEAILETLVAAIHIKMDKPLFEGAVKNKLINPEIVSPIADYISEILMRKIKEDQKSAENLLNCFRRYNWQKDNQ